MAAVMSAAGMSFTKGNRGERAIRAIQTPPFARLRRPVPTCLSRPACADLPVPTCLCRPGDRRSLARALPCPRRHAPRRAPSRNWEVRRRPPPAACADLPVPTWEVGVPLPARCRARGGARREVHHHGTGKYAASRPPPAGCADQRSAFQAVPALFPDRCCAVSLRFAQRCRCEHRRSLAPLPPYRRRWR